jgi:hypothetical protein
MTDTPRTDALVSTQPKECGINELADSYNKLLDFARRLERELAEAKRDAERYRWLRSRVIYGPIWSPQIIFDDTLDAAIDTAMNGGEK